MASRPYVVQQGDYLTKLAFRYGTTVKEILDDPKNADLKKQRHPEILNPLDIVYLPEKPSPPKEITVESENSFAGNMAVVDVEVFLAQEDGKPLAGKKVETTPKLGDEPLTTDGEGGLKLVIPVHVKVVRLTLPEARLQFDVQVGNLDPHDEKSGLLSRLRQLGYVGQEDAHIFARPWLNFDPAELNSRALASGIASFQKSRDKEGIEEATAEFCSALKDEYGC